MSTQGLNQSGSAQPAPPPQQQDNSQQSRKVSEKQANDFADRMTKEKRDKEKKSGVDKQQSLESLLAERNKSSKEVVQGRQEKGSHENTVQKKSAHEDIAHEDIAHEESAHEESAREKNGENKFQHLRDGSGYALVNTTQNTITADIQLRDIQQASSVKEIDAAVQKLADQIQVSAKDAVNGAEVRISLKDSVIPGTEIRIQRMGGELTVTMNTTSAEAGNFLAQHEASLQKMLAERFSNDKVQVNINMSGGDNQDTDGRSRNQYVAEDDDQNSSRNDRA